MSDFSGYLGSFREYWRKEISPLTAEKHISMLKQLGYKKCRWKTQETPESDFSNSLTKDRREENEADITTRCQRLPEEGITGAYRLR